MPTVYDAGLLRAIQSPRVYTLRPYSHSRLFPHPGVAPGSVTIGGEVLSDRFGPQIFLPEPKYAVGRCSMSLALTAAEGRRCPVPTGDDQSQKRKL